MTAGLRGWRADSAVAPVLGGGQVEAGDRPLGAPWLPSGEERKRWFTARFRLRSAGSVGWLHLLRSSLASRSQCGACLIGILRTDRDDTHRRRGAPGVEPVVSKRGAASSLALVTLEGRAVCRAAGTRARRLDLGGADARTSLVDGRGRC